MFFNFPASLSSKLTAKLKSDIYLDTASSSLNLSFYTQGVSNAVIKWYSKLIKPYIIRLRLFTFHICIGLPECLEPLSRLKEKT